MPFSTIRIGGTARASIATLASQGAEREGTHDGEQDQAQGQHGAAPAEEPHQPLAQGQEDCHGEAGYEGKDLLA